MGNIKVMLSPPAAGHSAHIEPSCASTMPRAKDSPG